MDLQPLRSPALNSQRIHRDEPSKLLHPAVIIISSSSDIVCEWNRHRPMTMRGLPGAQSGDSQNPVPPTPYHRDAWLNAWSPDIYKTGPPESLSVFPDHSGRLIQDYIPDPLRPVRMPSHALRIHELASHIPGLSWQLPTAWYWLLCLMLPRWHTDLFDQWEGIRRSRTKGDRATMPMRPLLQSWKVAIWRLKTSFPQIYH